MLYTIKHRTTYAYSAPVALSQHLAHLRPRTTSHQELLAFELSVEPAPAVSAQRLDYYSNHTQFLTVETPHKQLQVIASSQVQVRPPQNPDPEQTPAWDLLRDSQHDEFLFPSPHVPTDSRFAQYAAFSPGRPILAAVSDLIRRIHHDFAFDPRATTIATPLSEVLKKRRGVCQDFAHLTLACLRSLGLPARYVSGYLETVPPRGRARLVGADASHAWISFWCPGHGWIDADPTNNCLVADRHITLAWGRDFSDVSPLRGVVVGGGTHHLSVAVDVLRSL